MAAAEICSATTETSIATVGEWPDGACAHRCSQTNHPETGCPGGLVTNSEMAKDSDSLRLMRIRTA